MLQRIIVVSLMLGLTVGCKKESAKTPSETPKTNTEAKKASGQATPAPEAKDEAAKAEAAKTPTAQAPTPAEGAAKKDEAAKKPEAAPAAKTAEPEVAKKEDPAAKARREMAERRKRIQEIYALGRSKDAADAEKLKGIIVGEGPVYERASAIRALGREKRDAVIPALKLMVKDKATAVRIEASIKLYQWGEQKFSMPVLKELRKQGVALRRAFQTGYEKGRPTYDKNAAGFFKAGIKNENVYVRLDSAVGLVELGQEKLGLPVIKLVLEKEEKYHIRMAAVNYMTPLKGNEKVKELLNVAAKDADERVAKRARDILGIANVAKPEPAANKDAAPKPAAKK